MLLEAVKQKQNKTKQNKTNMSIYINEDHELRLVWYKYQNLLDDHKCSINMYWDEYACYEWEQGRLWLESQCRAEIYETRRHIRVENKKREELREIQREIRKYKREKTS